jgi:hypothetical protein
MTEISEFFELQYAHLCNYSSVDNNGNVNIMGIFSQVNSTKYPTTLGRFVLAIALKSRLQNDKEFEFSVMIKNPNGEINKPLVTKLRNDGKRNVINLFAEINNFVFNEPGNYEIGIFMDNERIKTIPLLANVVKG